MGDDGRDPLGFTERCAVLDLAIADHRGRIANTAFDSAPGECGSAVDTVKCAVKSRGRYSALADEPTIRGKHRCP